MKNALILPKVVSVEYPIVGFNILKSAMENLGYNYNFVSFNNAFFSDEVRDNWWGTTERMDDL